MSALPKMIYGGTRVGTVIYNGKEVLNIIEQVAAGNNRTIYHKHIGNPDIKGGCYTEERKETISVSHIWTLGEVIDNESGDHTGSQTADEDNSTYSYTTYRIADQHGHTAKVTYVYASSEGRKLCGQWVMKGMSDYADNTHDDQIEGSSIPLCHGTNNIGPWGGSKTYTTTKSFQKTYYDLGCGFNKE